ncbi:hypothetical protein FRC06_003748 [Ceratobasidium sp. 370]|nr:hypothetical protein FRC06_003748 [Ceratobasidium sp. 370]
MKGVCVKNGISNQYSTICQHFKQNFWSQEWRDSITDIGLPSGHTCSKILNTNNYAESFIKTFKYTMLGRRCNKQVDTLVIIIADLLLPFYKIWDNNRVHHTKEHVEITHNGYHIWSSGSVKKLDQDSQFQIDDLL